MDARSRPRRSAVAPGLAGRRAPLAPADRRSAQAGVVAHDDVRRAPETLHPALWLGHQLGRSGSRRAWRAALPLSMPSCPAAAGRAGRFASCCCRMPASARSACSRRPWSRRSARVGWSWSSIRRRRCRRRRSPASASTSTSCWSFNTRARVIPGSDSLWALEQALKSGHVGAVVAWLPPRLRAERLRRLQLAAHNHDGRRLRHARGRRRRPADGVAAAPRPAGGRRRSPARSRPQAARPAARSAAVARAADRAVGGGAPARAAASAAAALPAATFVDFA